jgi:hypothetical protein
VIPAPLLFSLRLAQSVAGNLATIYFTVISRSARWIVLIEN